MIWAIIAGILWTGMALLALVIFRAAKNWPREPMNFRELMPESRRMPTWREVRDTLGFTVFVVSLAVLWGFVR